MTDDRPRFSRRPLGVITLALGNLLISAVTLYILLAYGLMVGFWESLALGFGMMAVGAIACGTLMHLNRRSRWLWILTFCVLPSIYAIPSLIRFMEIGDSYPLIFWTSYPFTLVLASYIGTEVGDHFGWWNRVRKPMRKRYLDTIIRWLS